MTAPARVLPPVLARIRFPVIGAPLFIISNPKLVIAQCTAGVVGAMPALNARPSAQLDERLAEITEALAAYDRAHPDAPAAPFAINQIVLPQGSFRNAGMDPDHLPQSDPSKMSFASAGGDAAPRAWTSRIIRPPNAADSRHTPRTV